jgi:hypothetical protein|tara:strand:+ start:2350 stop:4113 length:1764 start_codon:yes stop_codon:yes gene_type:complete
MADKKAIIEVEIKDKGTKELKSLTQNLKDYNKELDKNRDAQRGLDNLTGGAISQFKAFRAQIKGNFVALKGLVKGLGAFKTALVATGIGAIVVLVGALAANWEKITKLLTGATIASQELAETTKAIADQEQRKLDALNSQDNILKLQGKTEKEILELKAQQTKQTITALEASIEAQKEVKRQQVATAKRGQEILSTILKFVSAPLTLIVAQIDAIFGSNYMKIFDDAASLVFDPEKIGEQADEELEKTEQNLARLKNSYAGYQLSLNKIQADNQKKREDELKKQYDKELKLLQDKIKKEIELTDKGNKDVGAIRRDFFKRNFDDSEASQLALSEFERDAKIKEIEESSANAIAKRMALDEVNKFYDTQAEAIRIDNAAKRKAQAEKEAKEEQERIEELEEKKRQTREKTFDNAVMLAGEESKVGKALLLAKQILLAKQLILDAKEQISNAKKTVTNATVNAAASSTELAKGASKAASAAPPPFNIPFILTFAATAAGIVSAMKSAVRSTKEAAAEAGASAGGGGENIQAPVIPTSNPAFNIVGAGGANQLADAIAGQNQKPIRAFVVEEDVSMASQLARKIKNRASL